MNAANAELIQSDLTDEYQYQEEILQGVSRTFALTIPQLPSQLANVVGNAYLLCRIADTIEDDKDLPFEQKQLYSEFFIDVVKGTKSAKQFAEELHPLLSPAATDAEKDLIKNTEPVIRISHSFNDRQRKALERCVTIMADGMVKYQDAETLEGLTDQPAMDEYCYYVAGVVGEMLTELFCDYSPEINKNYDELFQLSVSFGQGLQMTNILKDIYDDYERGACWLPAEVFQRHGFDLKDLRPGLKNTHFESGLGELIGLAHSHLNNALKYTLMMPSKETGIRKFCLWAIGMAILTLQNINQKRDFKDGSEVKISRSSVKKTIAATNLLIRSNKMLSMLFSMSAKGLPRTAIL